MFVLLSICYDFQAQSHVATFVDTDHPEISTKLSISEDYAVKLISGYMQTSPQDYDFWSDGGNLEGTRVLKFFSFKPQSMKTITAP